MISNYYKYRIPITIDSSKIDSDLTHFPLKVVVSGTSAVDIYSEIGSANKNIAFKDENDNQLYCEIEQTYDESGLSYVYHVSRNDWIISSTNDTTIYLCYDKKQLNNDDYVGYAGDTAAQSVWNSGFAARYGMAQDPSGGAGSIKDSTSGANHGASSGAMTAGDLVNSAIGKSIDFDGTDDCIVLQSTISLDYNSTTSCLCRPNSTGNLFYVGDGTSYIAFYTDEIIFKAHNAALSRQPHMWSPGELYNITTVVGDPGSITEIYVNGVSIGGDVISGLTYGILYIGRYNSGNDFSGQISSFWASDTKISTDWIKADYNSQTNQLNTIGSPETIPMPDTMEEVVWTPEYITSSLWLDADDSSTITLDGSSKVEQWNDKSGNARHAAQSNASYRPSVGTLGTLDALNFTGSAIQLTVPRGFITSSVSAVIVYGGESGYSQRILDQRSTGNAGTVKGWQIKSVPTTSSDILFYDDGAGNYRGVNGDLGYASTRIMSALFPVGGNAILYIDGTSLGSDTNGGSSPTDIDNTARDVTIGGNADGSTTQDFDGKIGEIVLLSSSASTEDRQKIEGYLTWKWGLEANLPVDHPYKNVVPTTYIDKIPTYYFEGTVIDGISQYVERNIRLYRYDTGELMNTTTSVSGSFFITTTYTGTHYITCHDLPYGEYNDLIFGKIIPGSTY